MEWGMQRLVFEIIAPNGKIICECYSEYMAKKICKALNKEGVLK